MRTQKENWTFKDGPDPPPGPDLGVDDEAPPPVPPPEDGFFFGFGLGLQYSVSVEREGISVPEMPAVRVFPVKIPEINPLIAGEDTDPT